MESKITITPDANGQYYAELLGVRFNVTKRLEDGRCTLEMHGHKLECIAKEPRASKPKKRK